MVSRSGICTREVVVDARHMLGRLSSILAKELLNGQRVTIVRCEEICFSGGLQIPSCSDLLVVSHAGKNRKSFVTHVSMMKVTMMRGIIADLWPWVVGLLARNDDADFDNKSTTGAQWFLMDKGGVQKESTTGAQ
ncbi:Ribosomal protein L13 [Cynara cardunculus var. scolymus]|uniref:Ribosomal protein L13 n=1 Tax=Cynara cardunculus var. scolymus TaxID=59895 RepID=A0A103Y0H5_CYNCS|nr:Ribosomal protein L13 [Cynara cardunculus var. scolymus]